MSPPWAMQQTAQRSRVSSPAVPSHSSPFPGQPTLNPGFPPRNLSAAQTWDQMGALPPLQAMHLMHQMGRAQQEAIARQYMLQNEMLRRASQAVVSELPSDGGSHPVSRGRYGKPADSRGGGIRRGLFSEVVDLEPEDEGEAAVQPRVPWTLSGALQCSLPELPVEVRGMGQGGPPQPGAVQVRGDSMRQPVLPRRQAKSGSMMSPDLSSIQPHHSVPASTAWSEPSRRNQAHSGEGQKQHVHHGLEEGVMEQGKGKGALQRSASWLSDDNFDPVQASSAPLHLATLKNIA
jgi:hypothetical protein